MFIGKVINLNMLNLLSYVCESFSDQFDISQWIFFQGTHLLSEPTWRYDDGSVISYFNWYASQPDSSRQDTAEYLCMRRSDQYQWHDCWKSMIGAFICEIQII